MGGYIHARKTNYHHAAQFGYHAQLSRLPPRHPGCHPGPGQSRLEAVIKEIYRPVAAACGCRWTAIERTLRTLSHRAWQVNPRLLSQMAGYPLRRAPSAAQFLEILTVHAARNFILPL